MTVLRGKVGKVGSENKYQNYHNNVNVWEQRIAEIEATMALPRFLPLH